MSDDDNQLVTEERLIRLFGARAPRESRVSRDAVIVDGSKTIIFDLIEDDTQAVV